MQLPRDVDSCSNRGENLANAYFFSGSGRVFLESGFSLKMVRDSGFGYSQEAGFAKIGHGMQDSIKESWMRNSHKKECECGIRIPFLTLFRECVVLSPSSHKLVQLFS